MSLFSGIGSFTIVDGNKVQGEDVGNKYVYKGCEWNAFVICSCDPFYLPSLHDHNDLKIKHFYVL